MAVEPNPLDLEGPVPEDMSPTGRDGMLATGLVLLFLLSLVPAVHPIHGEPLQEAPKAWRPSGNSKR